MSLSIQSSDSALAILRNEMLPLEREGKTIRHTRWIIAAIAVAVALLTGAVASGAGIIAWLKVGPRRGVPNSMQ